ncbi:hypothetical protein [Micromonospora globbae]|uniref:hypothetical protein n=1 Tax=Micromonospora globbae TaxID=1894969 RepID=UPI00341459E6
MAIRVVHSYKGTAKQGEQLVLFQIGGVVSTAEAGDTPPRMVLERDPLYTKGQQCLLMFTSGPQGTLRVVSPAGRYGVDRSGALTPMTLRGRRGQGVRSLPVSISDSARMSGEAVPR